MGPGFHRKAKFSMIDRGPSPWCCFMLIYYPGLAGFIANLAMVLNMAVHGGHLGCLRGFADLSPASRGLVLTIGMAVDSNIIIYERIREELRQGKSPRTAVDAGSRRAFWTVFDAHVTNFVAGIVLYSYGSAPSVGFAVTLLVGIVSNLLTSVWMSRWMFDLIVGDAAGRFPRPFPFSRQENHRWRRIRNFSKIIKPGINLEFIGNQKYWIGASITLLLVTFLMLPINAYVIKSRGHALNWGVDFPRWHLENRGRLLQACRRGRDTRGAGGQGVRQP